MTKGRKHYLLKIFDQTLMDFSIDVDSMGSIYVDIIDISSEWKHLLPLQMLPEPNTRNVVEWLEGRTIPKNRQFVDRILSAAGLSVGDTLGILDVSKGLSVNDSYWLDDCSNELYFSDINLFDNRFDETLALIAYTGYTPSQRRKAGLSSEWTTDGQFPKAWRREKDGIYLYKAGSDGFANAGMEPYSEYLASQVAEAMGLEHVNYDLKQWQGRLASVCKLMNTKEIAFVPFWKATGQSRFPQTLAVAWACSKELFEQKQDMIIFDALICNIDRHGANFGVLRSNLTGQVLGMAPLFDHNLSLFARDMPRDYAHFFERADTAHQPTASNLSFLQEAEIVMSERHHEMLRSLIGFEFRQHPDYPIDTERLDALNRFISQRTRQLLAIPVVDERSLQRDLEKVLSNIDNPIPIKIANDHFRTRKPTQTTEKTDPSLEKASHIHR